MTEQRKATPEQWADQEIWAPSDGASSCLLELRARVEALEATQHAHADISRQSWEKREPFYGGLHQLPGTVRAVYGAYNEPGGPTDEELLEVAAKALGYKSIPSDETCLTAEAGELLVFARAVLQRFSRPTIQPVSQPEMVNCHWDGPPPAPHTSVPNWFREEGSKGILRGLRISPLPSRGGADPATGCALYEVSQSMSRA